MIVTGNGLLEMQNSDVQYNLKGGSIMTAQQVFINMEMQNI